MSKRCRKEEMEVMPVVAPRPVNNCICNFPTLIILILIVLQFSKKKCCDGGKNQQVGNGILFIIALFYLSCAGCGTGGYGFGGGCGCGGY